MGDSGDGVFATAAVLDSGAPTIEYAVDAVAAAVADVAPRRPRCRRYRHCSASVFAQR